MMPGDARGVQKSAWERGRFQSASGLGSKFSRCPPAHPAGSLVAAWLLETNVNSTVSWPLRHRGRFARAWPLERRTARDGLPDKPVERTRTHI